MDNSSTQKLLYLFNILADGEKTKKDIIKEFENANITLCRSLINKYVKQYQQYGIDIKNKVNNKRENVYYINDTTPTLDFTREELNVISDVKKLLIAQKNYNRIRKIMCLFYKLAKYIKDIDMQREFVDFGYYSTLNWFLVRQLEKHCQNKDVIALDYVVPRGECMNVLIHADSLKISGWSQRLYLHGVFKDSKHFSHLPVDRIFIIKNVITKAKRFDISTNMLSYTVSKKLYQATPIDLQEKVVKETKNEITLERPVDDDFYIIQRLLSFCPEIYNISDERIKTLFREKLEILRTSYGDEFDK